MDYEWESQRQVVSKHFFLLGHVEQLCELHNLWAPVGVELTDANGAVWIFDYDPNVNEMRVPFSSPAMPVTIRVEDCSGQVVKQEFAGWTVQ